jgi:hypothetical protein
MTTICLQNGLVVRSSPTTLARVPAPLYLGEKRTIDQNLQYTAALDTLLRESEDGVDLDSVNDLRDLHGLPEWSQERLEAFLEDRGEWRNN